MDQPFVYLFVGVKISFVPAQVVETPFYEYRDLFGF